MQTAIANDNDNSIFISAKRKQRNSKYTQNDLPNRIPAHEMNRMRFRFVVSRSLAKRYLFEYFCWNLPFKKALHHLHYSIVHFSAGRLQHNVWN